MKLCECGCGDPAPIASMTHSNLGHVKGQPVRFISGHNVRGQKGKICRNWRGGKTNHLGYVLVYMPDHPRAGLNGYVLEHILVAEKILGRPLNKTEIPHHINEVRNDNRPENIYVCSNRAEHRLIHRCLDAYNACGHAMWRKCFFCQKYDSMDNLYIPNGKRAAIHRDCENKYQREYQKRRKANG